MYVGLHIFAKQARRYFAVKCTVQYNQINQLTKPVPSPAESRTFRMPYRTTLFPSTYRQPEGISLDNVSNSALDHFKTHSLTICATLRAVHSYAVNSTLICVASRCRIVRRVFFKTQKLEPRATSKGASFSVAVHVCRTSPAAAVEASEDCRLVGSADEEHRCKDSF